MARTPESTRPASRRDPDGERVEERRARTLDDARERGVVVERSAEMCRAIAGTASVLTERPNRCETPRS